MSWKMFGQIVLLIIIAVVVMTTIKVMKYKMCKMGKMKPAAAMSERGKNFSHHSTSFVI